MPLCSDTTILPKISGVHRPTLQPLPGLWGLLDCQLWSIKMEEDLGGLEIISWLHVKAAVGKLWGLPMSPRRREVISGHGPDCTGHTNSGHLILSRNECDDTTLFLGERSLGRVRSIWVLERTF